MNSYGAFALFCSSFLRHAGEKLCLMLVLENEGTILFVSKLFSSMC